MDKPKHAPGDLYLGAPSKDGGVWIHADGPKPVALAVYSPAYDKRPGNGVEAKDNAEEIILRWNAHPELVDALEKIANDPRALGWHVRKARSALDKAGR